MQDETRYDIYRAGDAWLIKSGPAQCGPHPSADEAIRRVAELTHGRADVERVAVYLWDRSFPELVSRAPR